MAILKKIYPLAAAILMTGCYEDFTPEIDTKPVLCLNGLITAGEPIEISVTRTWLYTDEHASLNHYVDDAAVSIYANGTPTGRDYIPREGDRIRIVAESTTYGMAEAEVTVPVSVPAESLKWEAEVTDRWDWADADTHLHSYRLNIRVKMTIADPEATDNYYHFSYSGFPQGAETPPEVTILEPVRFSPGRFNYEAEPIFSEHIGVFDAISGNDSEGFTFFTDRRFSGKTYMLNLQFNNASCDIRTTPGAQLPDCGLKLSLNTISLSLYNWSCYRWNIDSGTIGEFGDNGLGDPVAGYSNVSTGAGIVGARSGATYTINLKELLKKETTDNTPRSTN